MPDGHAPAPRRAKAGDPKVAILYTRRSTGKQDLTHEVQEAAAREWARREGVTIAGVYSDTISGGDDIDDCPALVEALRAIGTARAGVLLVAKRDRLARDMLKVGMLEFRVRQSGARLVSAAGEGNGDDPSDVLLRGIIDLFAQHEKLMTRLRTKVALKVKRKRGEKLGGVTPFGFTVTAGTRDPQTGKYVVPPRLIPDPTEQATIALMREWRAGGMAIRAIARELDARGVPTRQGGRWSSRVVERALRSSDGRAMVTT